MVPNIRNNKSLGRNLSGGVTRNNATPVSITPYSDAKHVG